MDSFKKALKQAIVEKANGVRFVSGHHPYLYSLIGKELTQLQPMDHDGLRTLIDSLLPQSPLAETSPVREGSISIVNYGELKLLASINEPLSLYAFIPPQGDSLFERIKSEINPPPVAIKPIELGAEEAAFDGAHRGQFALTQVNDYQTPQTGADTGFNLPPPPGSTSTDELMLQTSYVVGGGERDKTDTKLNDATQVASPAHHLFDQPLSPLPTPVPRPLIPYADLPPTPLEAEETATQTSLATASGTHDYHFAATQHSIENREFTRAFTDAAHQAMPAPPPPMVPAVPAASVLAPTPAETIYFGSAIPGETIERVGRLPIDAILEDMVKRSASDLHLTMNEPISLRIDGEIMRLPDTNVSQEQMETYLLPIIPPRNRSEFAKIHDTDFAYEVPGLARFRVNIFRDRMGVGAVLRQIPDKVLSADDLGLSPAIRKLCELHKGLVVVTGPTGSGKSTTLAAMIDLINETRSDHILTIEDPIEFVHKQKRCLINQREVHKHTGSFARALKAALREDPDIILIGEMRDLETVEIAIETAETGHLVFGTLHTNTAISTVDRLIDQFPSEQQEQVRVMLAESLKGVVSQTLVKKKGGGRVAAQEILLIDKAVASLIREGNTHMVQNHMQTQKAKGNLQLNDALMGLVTKGLIDPRDAYMKSIEKEALIILLQQKGINLEALKSAS